jgi:sigma-B regulation protein RsbU (phosphoserine phosphatase)
LLSWKTLQWSSRCHPAEDRHQPGANWATDGSSKRLTYCNAGHNPPLVLRSQKRPTDAPVLLKPTGAAIGLVEEADFGEDSLDLQKGDLLVLYTDGVTEAVNRHDQEFGRERLASFVRIADHLPARDVVNQIRQGLEAFSEDRPFVDDTTFVVCRITR